MSFRLKMTYQNMDMESHTLTKCIEPQDHLSRWIHTPQGIAVTHQYIQQLHHLDYLLKGEALLQLGGASSDPWLASMKYRHQWVIQEALTSPEPSLLTNYSQLPFDRHRFDCIHLPLFLEQYPGDLSGLFDELDRVLKSNGHLVVWGINPWGFWGLARRLKLISPEFNSIQLVSPLTIKHALNWHGFYVALLSGFYYLPPLHGEKALKRCEIFNEIGLMLWPFPASFYLMVFKKLDPIGLMPIPKIQESNCPIHLV